MSSDGRVVEALRRPTAYDPRSATTDAPAEAAVRHSSMVEVLRWPLPRAGMVLRFCVKTVALIAGRQVRAIYGLENLHKAPRSVILALNHTIHREAVVVPFLLVMHRGGRRIGFLSQWQYLMLPAARFLMRRTGVIAVTSNNIRPKFLNRLKGLVCERPSVSAVVKERLHSGEWVGIFPEGLAHHHPSQMLHGRIGMARLSLETGVGVLPVGIRFPDAAPDRPIREAAAMEVVIGELMTPPDDGDTSIAATRAWHAALMRELARLSGRSWPSRRGAR